MQGLECHVTVHAPRSRSTRRQFSSLVANACHLWFLFCGFFTLQAASATAQLVFDTNSSAFDHDSDEVDYFAAGDFDGDDRIELVTSCRYANSSYDIIDVNDKGYFETKRSLGMPRNGWLRASGDFDRDGDLDLLMHAYSAPSFMAKNNGRGGFEMVETEVSLGNHELFPSADFDSDGWVDYFTIHDGILLFHRNLRNNSFKTHQLMEEVLSFVVGDFNWDGHQDILAAQTGRDGLYLHPGTENLLLAPRIRVSEVMPYIMTSGDFNADGHIDIAGTQHDGILEVFYGGRRGFVRTSCSIPTESVTNLEIADLNADGLDDLVIGLWRSMFPLHILTSRDSMPLADVQQLQHEDTAKNLVVADLNTDGYPEIVLGCDDTSTVYTYWNRAGKGFEPINVASHIPSSSTDYEGLVLADLDKDGLDDLVLCDENASMIRLIRNKYGSWNGIETAFHWFPRPRAVAVCDYDSDSDLDVIASMEDRTALLIENIGNFRFRDPRLVARQVGAVLPRCIDLDGDKRPEHISVGAFVSSLDGDVYIVRGIGHGAVVDSEKLIFDDGKLNYDIGDFNGDGFPDMAVTQRDPKTVRVWENDTTGKFNETAVHTLPGYALSIKSWDMEKDGDLDLAVMSGSTTGLYLLENSGQGVFAPTSQQAQTLVRGGMFFLEDLNGDGSDDLFMTSGDSAAWFQLGKGDQFSPHSGFACGSTIVRLGNINGDPAPDAVSFDKFWDKPRGLRTILNRTPMLESVSVLNNTEVLIVFSQPMSESALKPASYSIENRSSNSAFHPHEIQRINDRSFLLVTFSNPMDLRQPVRVSVSDKVGDAQGNGIGFVREMEWQPNAERKEHAWPTMEAIGRTD